MTCKKQLIIVVILWGLSICLGLFYIHEIKSTPFFFDPVIDEESYDAKAMGILKGSWPGDKVYYQDPLYPYFLSGVYSIFGRDLYMARVVNVLLASLNLLVLYFLGRLVFNSRVGILAMLAGLLYQPYYFYQGMLTKTSLAILVADLSLLLMIMAGRKALVFSLLAGIVAGLAAMSRGNFLAIIPLFAVWLWWVKRPLNKAAVASVMLFLLGVGASILPVTLHNIRCGEMVLITSQGGQNFYIGNQKLNDSGTYYAPPFVRAHPAFEENDFRREAVRIAGRELSASELSRFWYGRAFGEMLEGKKRAAMHFVKKASLALNGFEVSDNLNYYFFKRRYARMLSLPLLTFGSAGAFGLAGIILALKRRKSGDSNYGKGLLISYLTIYWLTMAAFYVFSRYRMLMVGPLLVFGAYASVALYERFKEGRKKAAAGLTIVIIIAGILINIPMMEPTFDGAHFLLGNHLYKRGDLEGAVKSYQHGLKLNPKNELIRSNLALIYMEAGMLEEAQEEFERTIVGSPGYPGARTGLAEVYFKQGKFKEAAGQYGIALKFNPDDAIIWVGYGASLERMSELAKAHWAYNEALKREPENTVALQGMRRTQPSEVMP